MTEITASAVKSLRDRTGAGMMDCKRALEEAAGDEERAIDLLRQRGAAKAAKRAGKEASEGAVVIERDDETGAVSMVELASETDFVARNDEFLEFGVRAARVAARSDDLPEGEVREGEELAERPAGEPLGEVLNGLVAKIGERLEIRRYVRYEPAEDATVGAYVHFGNKIGVLVELVGAEPSEAVEEAARDVAMHVAAASPIGVSPDDIPAEARERERAVLEEQAKAEGKPPEITAKIVEGRMRKFYQENALLWQGFVKDPNVKLEDMLEGIDPSLTVRRFARFEVGD